MTKTVNVSIRMDAVLKNEAEELFDSLGMDMATAVHFFIRQAVRKQRIPFAIPRAKPKFDYDASLAEARRVARDPNAKSWTSVEEYLDYLKS